MGVTKTDFIRGLQCPRMLWLDKHHPEFKVIPPDVQEKLDAGNEFGDKAMGIFGPYVEVTTFKEDSDKLDYQQMIEKTKGAISLGVEVICEAAFSYYGHYCAVDILRKNGDCYDIYEVKNSPQVEDIFVQDIAFQRYLLKKCGVNVKNCYVIYHGPDEKNPFAIEDVTDQATRYWRHVDDNIWILGKIKFQKEEVLRDVGCHCEKPYRCWYWDYCHKG